VTFGLEKSILLCLLRGLLPIDGWLSNHAEHCGRNNHDNMGAKCLSRNPLSADISAAIDAVVLSGGSLFGLDAAGGVVSYLRGLGRGLRIGTANVPIAVQAITFDLLNGGNKDWGRMPPYWEMGWRAAEAASSELFSLGTFGGGFGATTVNLKGGLGSASTTTGRGYIVGAITVVNAAGTPKLDLPLQTARLVPSPAAFFEATALEIFGCATGVARQIWIRSLSTPKNRRIRTGASAVEASTTEAHLRRDDRVCRAAHHGRRVVAIHEGQARAVPSRRRSRMDGVVYFIVTHCLEPRRK
jgi:hypothetical protein